MGRYQSAADGKEMASADVQSKFKLNWSSVFFAEKLKFSVFLKNRTPVFPKLVSVTCKEEVVICRVGPAACVPRSEKSAVSSSLLFV